MRQAGRLFFLSLFIGSLFAQLLPEQRAFDFQSLAALYAKRYAPYEWKQKALGFDAMDLAPWLERIRNAKDDLEFYEIEAEYVASLQDTHSGFSMPSTFSANLGMTVDIYDGKVLIDSINRAQLPAAQFPFTVGDELVSVDGKSVGEWIDLLSKWRRYGSPGTTRRAAAGRITVRTQSVHPRAVEIGDTAAVVIRRANGNEESYTIPWSKSGLPIYTVGPVPAPKTAGAPEANAAGTPPFMQLLDDLQTWKLPDGDPLMRDLNWTDEAGQPRRFTAGQGQTTPIFRAGLPTNFVTRLGGNLGYHFSGTYTANGRRIGYLRIPSFAIGGTAPIAELTTEIAYMQNNTDGLVLDVMRNSGGGCYMLDAAARLIPYPFYFFGEEIRVTQDRLNSMQSYLDMLVSINYDEWIVNAYKSFVSGLKDAYAANRGMTYPIPACTQYNSSWPPALQGNLPAATVYTKPMIVLIDEFSISAAEIFPAMIQDNGRAPLVGMRTSGGGGSISGWNAGFYSESSATNTNTLVVRNAPVVTPDLPAAPYVENIGARPDITLDYMTRDNLMTGGKSFVDAFTAIMLDQIDRAHTSAGQFRGRPAGLGLVREGGR